MQINRTRLVGLLAVILLAQTSSAALAAELALRVTDEHHHPIWCRVEVRGQDKKMYQGQGTIPSGETNPRRGFPWYLGSFLMNGSTKAELPPGTYTVVAEHGLEYEHFERRVTVSDTAPTSLSIQLKPWIRMEKLGWWSADMHVHRPPKQGDATCAAEDLNLLVLANRGKRVFFDKDWPAQGLEQEAPDRWVSLRNAEDERRGGAWIMDGLEVRLAMGPESGWYPPGLQYVRAAIAQRAPGAVLPWFDLDMSIWWEAPVMVALQTPDSIDIINNQFMQYGIDSGAYWGKPIDRAIYPGGQGFVDYTLDLYYRYLNLGYHIAPSAGTGTGVMPSPAGYDRIYAYIDGPFSLAKWYTAVRDGHSFVTNGPILFFKTRLHGSHLRVDVKALAREPIVRIEIVANGKIIKSWELKANQTRAQKNADLDVHGYSWVAARCFLNTSYTVRLAHSSPVYLHGTWDSSADAKYFIDWIDQLMVYVRSQADKHLITPDQLNQLLANYTQARQVYERKLAQNTN